MTGDCIEFGHKRVVLYKLFGNEWSRNGFGYLSPNPLEINKRVWVGRRTEQEGFRTSPVIYMVRTNIIPDSVFFETKNRSYYLIVPMCYINSFKISSLFQ